MYQHICRARWSKAWGNSNKAKSDNFATEGYGESLLRNGDLGPVGIQDGYAFGPNTPRISTDFIVI